MWWVIYLTRLFITTALPLPPCNPWPRRMRSSTTSNSWSCTTCAASGCGLSPVWMVLFQHRWWKNTKSSSCEGYLVNFLSPWQIKNGQTRHNSSFELGQRQIQTPFYRGILWNPVTFQLDHLAGANRGIPLTSKMNQNQRPRLNWVLWCDSAGSRHIFEEKIQSITFAW